MKTWLILSLAVNALLGGLLLRTAKQPVPVAASSVVEVKPTPFHWRQLESADYREYIANLRGVGCPEQTVRDIIVADVDSLYAARRRRLQPDRTLEAGLRTLQAEEIRLLDSLLGTRTIIATEAPVEPPAHVRRVSPAQENIDLPLVLRDVDPTALKLNEEQRAALASIRNDFVEAIGGTNQDPNDPDYRKRWLQAQPMADDLLRGLLGLDAFLSLQSQAKERDLPSR